MRNDRVCVGGHDLDAGFQSVRLLRADGTNMLEKDPLQIGDVWEIDYRPRPGVQRPHVEDVLVISGKRDRRIANVERYLRQRVTPRLGTPQELFDGTVTGTPSGTAYVPDQPPLPTRSTGYWIPDSDLYRRSFENKTRFIYAAPSLANRLSWVGMEDPPETLAAGNLVRVSLARLWSPPSAPSGYYVQISGVY